MNKERAIERDCNTKSERIALPRKVYLHGFGQSRCATCHNRTIGKLCDYVTGSCGGYFTNCVPLCSRCHKRVAKTKAQPPITH